MLGTILYLMIYSRNFLNTLFCGLNLGGRIRSFPRGISWWIFQELYFMCGSEKSSHGTEKKESIRMSSLTFGCEIKDREASTGSCCGLYKI